MAENPPPNIPVYGGQLQAPCPPRRRDKTQDAIINMILQCSRPCYMCAERAWVVLGYRGAQRPTQLNFERQVNKLWWHLHVAEGLKAREAKAAILDALRAIGYSHPKWTTATPWLALRSAGTFSRWSTGKDWARLPPPAPMNQPAPSDLEAKDALWKAQTDHARPPAHDNAVDNHIRDAWQKYHRFQNFVVSDDANIGHTFRTVHMPEGAFSLWDAIAYNRYSRIMQQQGGATLVVERGGPQGDGFLHAGVHVKLGVWAYFTHAITDRRHPRFRDYNLLNVNTRRTMERWGEVSLLRSLHANDVGTHGRAAWPACLEILHVVADFYGTQVLLFHPDPHGQPLHPEAQQYATSYTYSVFGQYSGLEPQILLVSNDGLDFDAVEWAPPDFGAGGPVPAAAPRPFSVHAAYIRGMPPHPWWQNGQGAINGGPPARVSFPAPHMHACYREEPPAGVALPAGVVPAPAGVSGIPPETVREVECYRDMPGVNRVWPTAAEMAGWGMYLQPQLIGPPVLAEAQAPNNWALRFGGCANPAADNPLWRMPLLDDPRLVYQDREVAKLLHSGRDAERD